MSTKAGVKMPKKKQISEDRVNLLKVYLTSLYYLAEEADKDGFTEIHLLLKKGIHQIDEMINPKNSRTHNEIIDESLYRAMQFLYQINQISDTSRQEFITLFEVLKEIFGKRSLPKYLQTMQ